MNFVCKLSSVSNYFSIDELAKALRNYKPKEKIAGEKNFNWKDGLGEKYVRIVVKGRKVRRSHIVWRIENKMKIPRGFVIHHKNEDKRDDRISNLELVEYVEHSILNLKRKLKGG
jgi:hypothetical protein